MSGIKNPTGKLQSLTWANRPSVSANPGASFFCSDLGAILYSNGKTWNSQGPINLAGIQAHVYVPSSGSIGNNGALTLTTAMQMTYSAGVWLYFPANAIFAGSTAGIYYVVMSSTTAGTIYNNQLSGLPYFIDSPTPFVATGPGAYTQTTSTDITLLSLTIPGGLVKNFGSLVVESAYLNNNSANNKTRKVTFGGQTLNSTSSTTNQYNRDNVPIFYSNNAQLPRGPFSNGYLALGAASALGITSEGADNTLAITGSIAVATDYLGLLSASVLVG